METRSLHRANPAPTQLWEVTWEGGETEIWHQVGDEKPSTERRSFRTAEIALTFVQDQIAARRSHGFVLTPSPRAQERCAAELSLWDHVLANPDDHHAQMVLADWLIDRADPLGELILAGHQPDQSARYVQLRTHVHDHLFVPWPDVTVIASWHRGFVRKLSLAFDTHDEASYEAPEVTTRLAQHLFVHPAMWLLTELHVSTGMNVPLAAIVEALVTNGPHPALRTLVLTTRDTERVVDLRPLWSELPGLVHLEMAGHHVQRCPRFRTGPLPDGVHTLGLRGARWLDVHDATNAANVHTLRISTGDDNLADVQQLLTSPGTTGLRRLTMNAPSDQVVALLDAAPAWAAHLEHLDAIPLLHANTVQAQQILPELLASQFPALKTVAIPEQVDWSATLGHRDLRYVTTTLPQITSAWWPLDDEDHLRGSAAEHTPTSDAFHDGDVYDLEDDEDDRYDDDWDPEAERATWRTELDHARGALSPDDPFDRKE